MKKNITIILLISLMFVLGMRGRYAPAFWRAISGGIEYTLGNVTIGTGNNFTIGTTQWNSGDEMDGEKIKDDTIDDDSIDFSDVTLADFDYETADKMFHSNNAGDVTEITLGADGTFLESNGATSAPVFRTLTSVDVTGAAETYLMMETVIKTINLDSSDDNDDFEFDDSQNNVTEQTVDMGAIVPAYAELVSAQLRCFETVAGSGSAVMAIDLGTSDGGAEIFATANIDTANDISATGAGDGPEIVATAAAKNVWINATPTANWDTLTAGRWSVMITYIDYGAVHTAGIP